MTIDIWLLLYTLLALLSSAALLSSPYLRITSLGWFIAIWFLPFAGAIFFLLTIVRTRKSSLDGAYGDFLEHYKYLKADKNVFERLGYQYDYLPYFALTEYTLLRDEQFFDDLCESIDRAEKKIWITTYIFQGRTRKGIVDKLRAAHQRGVDVRLLVDRVGSAIWSPTLNAYSFSRLPFKPSVFHESRLKSLVFIEKRLHSKIIVIDDIGYVGSHNLRDKAAVRNKKFVHNISLKFSGDIVAQLEAVFTDIWFENTGVRISLPDRTIERRLMTDELPARIIYSDPIDRAHHYNRYITLLLSAARKRICIWMPYIIPTHAMRSAIIAASRMGMDVRILMPSRTESRLVDNAHYLVLKEFHENGVACALSHGHFDHAKLLIIDDMVILGSTNLDYRSLYRNYEANIEICSPVFADSARTLFDEAFESAEPVIHCDRNILVHMKNQLTSLIAGLY